MLNKYKKKLRTYYEHRIGIPTSKTDYQIDVSTTILTRGF